VLVDLLTNENTLRGNRQELFYPARLCQQPLHAPTPGIPPPRELLARQHKGRSTLVVAAGVRRSAGSSCLATC
jgi:hypothetical protein